MTISLLAPIRGVAEQDDRPGWLEQRRGGITATEVRIARTPSGRRRVISEKVTPPDDTDRPYVKAWAHGKYREPIIAAWAAERFGITPESAVYSHPENPRHLASPDGYARDPFTGAIMVGPGSCTVEIKTTRHDLTPGVLDEGRRLVSLVAGSRFDKSDYYDQIQWQMHVMGAEVCLFLWEMNDGTEDVFTGHWLPLGEPRWAWIPRDENRIAELVVRADSILAEVDAARASVTSLPPVSPLDPTRAQLVADLLAARDAEAVAVAAKQRAWKALQEHYLAQPDDSIDAGFATITVTSKAGVDRTVDEEAARTLNPTEAAAYDRARADWEAVLARNTTETPTVKRSLTITPAKG